ncbi:MAG TPA: hypothetical protein VF335_10380 [Chitinivibrionales bacterium]
MSGKRFITVILCVLLSAHALNAQTVKRGRNEGTISFPASNVLGNGNIDFFLASSARYSLSGFTADPILGAQIGISDIMQLTGQWIPVATKGLGPIEAHLQITTPGNDNLRFVGLALRADLFLSSIQDTISQTAQKDKPQYNPYLLPSIIVDADWLALWKSFPVKTYVALGMADNVDLLTRYNELYMKFAFEWKMYQHGVYLGAGLGLYQEKATRIGAGDGGYPQNYFWIEPGGRYRLWKRISVVGSTKLTLFQNVKDHNPLKPELFNVSLRLEAPVLFKETNTEAIRTLVFMEKKKNEKSDQFEKNLVSGKNLLTDLNASLVGAHDSLIQTDALDEKEQLKKRREETQKKMDEINTLFMQLDQDERTGSTGFTDSAGVLKK